MRPAGKASGRNCEQRLHFLRDVTVGNVDRVGPSRKPEGRLIIFGKASAQRELSKSKMSDPA